MLIKPNPNFAGRGVGIASMLPFLITYGLMPIHTGSGIIIGRMTHYNCRICNSAHREKIEEMLGQNLQYREIAKKFLYAFDCGLHLLEQSITNHKKHIPKALTYQEEELLKNLSEGTVSIDQMSRIVAVKVFEKMLKNPDDFRFIDFFRAELLRLKQEENKVEVEWGKEIIMRFFSGKLPPRICPTCGENLYQINT